SAAIVRAANAARSCRPILQSARSSGSEQVRCRIINSLLRWTNGFAEKTDRSLIPLSVGEMRYNKLNINVERDQQQAQCDAHQGDFCNTRGEGHYSTRERVY